MFFQNKKTNWKRLIILALVALLIGAGFVVYYCWWLPYVIAGLE